MQCVDYHLEKAKSSSCLFVHWIYIFIYYIHLKCAECAFLSLTLVLYSDSFLLLLWNVHWIDIASEWFFQCAYLKGKTSRIMRYFSFDCKRFFFILNLCSPNHSLSILSFDVDQKIANHKFSSKNKHCCYCEYISWVQRPKNEKNGRISIKAECAFLKKNSIHIEWVL